MKPNSGSFAWYELLTTDPKSALAFYGDVVGWKTEPWHASDYTMIAASQGPLGGVMPLPEPARAMGAPSHWMASVQVSSANDTVAKARKLGAQVLVEPTDLPEVGRYAVIQDPQGATIAIIEPQRPMDSHDSSKAGEFCWRELITTDHEKGFAFYRDLFGWQVVEKIDMGPMGTYLIYGSDGQRYGGMFTKPPSMPFPSSWVYYTHVDDLDGAIARAKAKGAELLMGPETVPTGERIAQLKDPQGAVFALHGPRIEA